MAGEKQLASPADPQVDNDESQRADASRTVTQPEIKTKAQIEAELAFNDPRAVVADEASAELIAQASDIYNRINAVEIAQGHDSEDLESQCRFLGEKLLREMARHCEQLKTPVQALVGRVAAGESLDEKIEALETQIIEIDPQRVDFKQNTFKSLLANLPGIGTPVARWSSRFQEAETDLKEALDELASEREQLERDNTALRDDQRRMRELGFKLKDFIMLAQLLSEKINVGANAAASEKSASQRFCQSLNAHLLKRIAYLEQRLALNQQSLLACELVIRNNRELIIGLDRTLSVTVAAVDDAASLRQMLNRAKDKKDNSAEADEGTGDNKAADTEESAQRSVIKLQQAFAAALQSLEEIDAFRGSAHEEMSHAMRDIDEVSEKIQRALEDANGGDQTAYVPGQDIEIKDH